LISPKNLNILIDKSDKTSDLLKLYSQSSLTLNLTGLPRTADRDAPLYICAFAATIVPLVAYLVIFT
jgi:hypothetical protein